VTARTACGIPVRPRGVEGESTLVEIHDGTLFNVFVPSDSRLEL
jgi:hypothetical protein